MNFIPPIVLMVALAAAPPVLAATMSFEDATAILAASCAADIDANCRGVNLDASRLKDCLTRNQDSVSPQCKADYVRAFDAIGKRVAARAAVHKSCEREATKLCGAGPKQDAKAIACLLTATRGISANCNRAISEAGYR
jgi:hypothetical protein